MALSPGLSSPMIGATAVRKLAETIAATVLCGELSLEWAILAEERVHM